MYRSAPPGVQTSHLRLLWLVLTMLGLLGAGCTSGQPQQITVTPAATPAPTVVIATPIPSAPTPTASSSTPGPSASPDSGAAVQAQLDYYLMRDSGGRFWVEPVSFTYDPAAVDGAVAREAVTRLLAADDMPGLVTVVPDGTELRDIAVADGLLRIDLSSDVADNTSAGAAVEEIFQQVLAHTGSQFSTVDRVQLLVEGAPVTDLWGHLDWSTPFQADPFIISPIIITNAMGLRGDGGGSIQLAGTANVFEAVFQVVVSDSGRVVQSSPVMATCGSGCRGDWEATIEGLPAGSYTVTAGEEDASDGEGFTPFEVSLRVDVP